MNKKKLTGKITVVVGGGSAMGLGIVRACWQKMLSSSFLLPIRLRSAGLPAIPAIWTRVD